MQVGQSWGSFWEAVLIAESNPKEVFLWRRGGETCILGYISLVQAQIHIQLSLLGMVPVCSHETHSNSFYHKVFPQHLLPQGQQEVLGD